MHPDEHEQVALELETLIRDIQATIDRIETYGLNNTMTQEYQALLDILDDAIKKQREHTQGMLSD
mgnify:FL=1